MKSRIVTGTVAALLLVAGMAFSQIIGGGIIGGSNSEVRLAVYDIDTLTEEEFAKLSNYHTYVLLEIAE